MEVQKKFSVSKRTANSIIYDMKGRYKALKELKKTEQYQLTPESVKLCTIKFPDSIFSRSC